MIFLSNTFQAQVCWDIPHRVRFDDSSGAKGLIGKYCCLFSFGWDSLLEVLPWRRRVLRYLAVIVVTVLGVPAELPHRKFRIQGSLQDLCLIVEAHHKL